MIQLRTDHANLQKPPPPKTMDIEACVSSPGWQYSVYLSYPDVSEGDMSPEVMAASYLGLCHMWPYVLFPFAVSDLCLVAVIKP